MEVTKIRMKYQQWYRGNLVLRGSALGNANSKFVELVLGNSIAIIAGTCSGINQIFLLKTQICDFAESGAPAFSEHFVF